MEFSNVKSLLLTTVALADPDVLKLAVPATFNMPAPAIAPSDVAVNEPVVVRSTPKPTPPVPALMVIFPKPDEAVPEKLTELPAAVAFKVNGPEKEVTLSTVMVPLELFPIIRSVDVI